MCSHGQAHSTMLRTLMEKGLLVGELQEEGDVCITHGLIMQLGVKSNQAPRRLAPLQPTGRCPSETFQDIDFRVLCSSASLWEEL